MINKETLKEIIVSNESFIRGVKHIVKREGVVVPGGIKKVVAFYGVRRSGKTYCLFDLFKQNPHSTLYIDFEDERLADFELGDFQKIKDAFLEIKPELIGKELVFLLDEVQNIKGWEKFARRITEREKIKVFVTGSSSKMAPQQLHTVLRGRSWGIEMFPFSFREYLLVKNIEIKDKTLVYGEKRALIKKQFSDYLAGGGFPEISFVKSETEKKKIIREYLDAIFFKDLVERFKVSNIVLMDTLREKLFSSFALKLSMSAFYKQYKDKFPFSKDSLFSYYRHFLESMTVFEVKKFSASSYKRTRNPAKIYLIDTGLSKSVGSKDLGRLLENLVYLELKRKGHEIYYFEEKNECDFVIKEKEKYCPIQVTLELTEDDLDREINGLVEACKYLGREEGLIITADDEKDLKKDGIKIRIVPAWKWLIQNGRVL